MIYLLAPGDIPTGGAKGALANLGAWFTPARIGGIAALVIVVALVRLLWKSLTANPWVWAVVVVAVLLALGVITLAPRHDPGHQPLVPATGPPIPR